MDEPKRLLTRSASALAIGVMLTAWGSGASVLAQGPVDSVGVIRGLVLEADGVTPIADAMVSVAAVPSNWIAVPSRPQVITTRADGSYRFGRLPLGTYQLRIRHIGYRPTTLDVELHDAGEFSLSAILEVAPIMLAAIEVTASTDLFGHTRLDDREEDVARVGIERWRQQQYLGSDVRAFTQSDLAESAALGGDDLLRAMQRLPGASTRDDWTSELRVRGASWDQTRIYFDGLPLFNPMHGGGVVSAINASAVSGVVFQPGVRSVSGGAGAAAAVDLMSRTPLTSNETRGDVHLGLFSGGVTLDRTFNDGELAMMVAVRRSTLKIGGEIGDPVRGTQFGVPDWADVVGRVDIVMPEGRTLELSGIWERDWTQGGLRDAFLQNELSIGSLAGRATLNTPTFGWMGRYTIGYSQSFVDIINPGDDLRLDEVDRRQTQRDTNGDVAYVVIRGEVESLEVDAHTWRVGYEFIHQRVDYRGAPAAPFGRPTQLLGTTDRAALSTLAVWGERRWQPEDGLTLQGGLRVEGSAPDHAGARVRLAPRFSARYRADERTTVSAGIGRSYQHLQAFAPAGLRLGPSLPVAHIWTLTDDQAPPLRADLVTAGAEYWLSESWLASLNAYIRWSDGIALPDPTPGPLTEPCGVGGQVCSRDLEATGSSVARGTEFSIRRLAGALNVGASYSVSRVSMSANGLTFPAAEDRTHAIDLTARWRTGRRLLGGSVTLGAAYAAFSGAPYTRLRQGAYDCDFAADTCTQIEPNVIGAPNAQRGSWYSSLSVYGDWTRKWSAWQFTFYLQTRNIGGFTNGVTYTPIGSECALGAASTSCDRFESGVNALTTTGIRIAF